VLKLSDTGKQDDLVEAESWNIVFSNDLSLVKHQNNVQTSDLPELKSRHIIFSIE